MSHNSQNIAMKGPSKYSREEFIKNIPLTQSIAETEISAQEQESITKVPDTVEGAARSFVEIGKAEKLVDPRTLKRRGGKKKKRGPKIRLPATVNLGRVESEEEDLLLQRVRMAKEKISIQNKQKELIKNKIKQKVINYKLTRSVPLQEMEHDEKERYQIKQSILLEQAKPLEIDAQVKDCQVEVRRAVPRRDGAHPWNESVVSMYDIDNPTHHEQVVSPFNQQRHGEHHSSRSSLTKKQLTQALEPEIQVPEIVQQAPLPIPPKRSQPKLKSTRTQVPKVAINTISKSEIDSELKPNSDNVLSTKRDHLQTQLTLRSGDVEPFQHSTNRVAEEIFEEVQYSHDSRSPESGEPQEEMKNISHVSRMSHISQASQTDQPTGDVDQSVLRSFVNRSIDEQSQTSRCYINTSNDPLSDSYYENNYGPSSSASFYSTKSLYTKGNFDHGRLVRAMGLAAKIQSSKKEKKRQQRLENLNIAAVTMATAALGFSIFYKKQ